MFENIGCKIKMLAKVCCWVGIFVSVIYGIILLSENNNELIGLSVFILGPLFSLIGSFVIYGFGQLIENSDKLVELNSNDNIYSTSDEYDNQDGNYPDANGRVIELQKEEKLKFLLEMEFITKEEYDSKIKEWRGEIHD